MFNQFRNRVERIDLLAKPIVFFSQQEIITIMNSLKKDFSLYL